MDDVRLAAAFFEHAQVRFSQVGQLPYDPAALLREHELIVRVDPTRVVSWVYLVFIEYIHGLPTATAVPESCRASFEHLIPYCDECCAAMPFYCYLLRPPALCPVCDHIAMLREGHKGWLSVFLVD